MPLFRYRAVAPGGETVEGDIEAADRAAAARALQDRAHVPIRIAQAAGPGAAPAAGPSWYARPLFAGGRLRREVDRLADGLAALLKSGVTLEEALAILADAADRPAAAELYQRLRERVRTGRDFSAALAAEGALFDGFTIALAQAGEAGGRLDTALAALAAYRQRARAFGDAIRNALVYPLVLVAFGALSVGALMIFVLPEFERLFREGGRELPWLTRVIFGAADGVRDWGWLALLLAAGAYVLWRGRLADPAARRRFDASRLRWPVYGRLRLLMDSERLMRALAALLGNGVDVPAALSLAAATLGNAALAQGLGEAAGEVRRGMALPQAIAGSGPWPPALTRMVRVGMETGRLADLCAEAAEMFGREAETRATRLVALLEPALIIGIGLLVALVILSVLSAIVGLNALAL